MLYRDILVETPYPLTEVEDRGEYQGRPLQIQCTYCGTQSLDPWYPIDQITVYRVWTSISTYSPEVQEKYAQGGTWQWRCPKHPKRAWAPHSHEAPDEL